MFTLGTSTTHVLAQPKLYLCRSVCALAQPEPGNQVMSSLVPPIVVSQGGRDTHIVSGPESCNYYYCYHYCYHYHIIIISIVVVIAIVIVIIIVVVISISFSVVIIIIIVITITIVIIVIVIIILIIGVWCTFITTCSCLTSWLPLAVVCMRCSDNAGLFNENQFPQSNVFCVNTVRHHALQVCCV